MDIPTPQEIYEKKRKKLSAVSRENILKEKDILYNTGIPKITEKLIKQLGYCNHVTVFNIGYDHDLIYIKDFFEIILKPFEKKGWNCQAYEKTEEFNYIDFRVKSSWWNWKSKDFMIILYEKSTHKFDITNSILIYSTKEQKATS
jgi:hypothetical protein